MSGPLVLVVGVIYAYVTYDQFIKGDIGHALMFFGYTIASVGLYFASK